MRRCPRPRPGRRRAATSHRLGLLPYWDQEGAYQDALAHADQLRTVSPFWYEAKSATRVDGHPGAGERRIIDGLHAAGIHVVPTVMEQMKSDVLAALVTSPDRRAEHITALLDLVRSRAYDGIDLDYESIASTGDATYRAVGAAYTALVRDLCFRLHALGKVCFATVNPKTATTGRVWDYRSLGQVADGVRIMAYNLHYATGTPGPLSSTAWYDEILRRATAEIPVDKIEMSLPAYGWDWAEGSDEGARHVTSKDAEALREAGLADPALHVTRRTASSAPSGIRTRAAPRRTCPCCAATGIHSQGIGLQPDGEANLDTATRSVAVSLPAEQGGTPLACRCGASWLASRPASAPRVQRSLAGAIGRT